ncbi:ScbA/BarX family gamma-butyrolactone biosynthesis protein [Streptomyces sp. TRM68367]|uniref:ScbA/BarX family gamma-butyrolactone biosynthesis protein n=1 Tax=Streptomyces sp. TRM68367 TaxID=2758415 RepID=UPI0021D07521|nr:ScbA/BarX family gamma-butyrolactone biosynthesis protein [Streptomyces sp. TRM68367]
MSAPTEDQTGPAGGPANRAGHGVGRTPTPQDTATSAGAGTTTAAASEAGHEATTGTAPKTASGAAPDAVPGAAPEAPSETAEVTRVTKELAHRTTESDVFPTHWTRLSDTRFRVTAHWPADHPFFGPVDDRHQDPMVVGETLRQTSMALAHAEFGAPADTHFVMRDLEIRTDLAALLLADAAEPVEIDVECSEIRRRGRGLGSVRTTMEFRRAGKLVARGTGSTGCTSPAAYQRLRARQLAALGTPVPLIPGVPPEQVGRARAQDVVLAPADRPGVWRLRVDTGHPVLFPRPNDHVPGMVLFEAARQAAAATTDRRPFLPADMAVAFSRYAELDNPCWIETEVLDEGPESVTVRVSGQQDGESVFTTTLTWANPASGPASGPSPVRFPS